MGARRQALERALPLTLLEHCLVLMTHLTMDSTWGAGRSGRKLSEQVGHDVLVLRLAYARVAKVTRRPSPQGVRALATLAVAIRAAEIHQQEVSTPPLTGQAQL